MPSTPSLRALVVWVLLGAAVAPGPSRAGDAVSFGRFGQAHLTRLAGPADRVALFVSGDGGWNLGVVDMARALAELGALVVGIDVTHYLREVASSREPCVYAAADFEALSQPGGASRDLPHSVPHGRVSP